MTLIIGFAFLVLLFLVHLTLRTWKHSEQNGILEKRNKWYRQQINNLKDEKDKTTKEDETGKTGETS